MKNLSPLAGIPQAAKLGMFLAWVKLVDVVVPSESLTSSQIRPQNPVLTVSLCFWWTLRCACQAGPQGQELHA